MTYSSGSVDLIKISDQKVNISYSNLGKELECLFTPDDKFIITGSSDGILNIIDIVKKKVTKIIENGEGIFRLWFISPLKITIALSEC